MVRFDTSALEEVSCTTSHLTFQPSTDRLRRPLAFDVRRFLVKRIPLPPEHLATESQRLFELLNEADDLPTIVVGVGFIDACVASLLSKYFLESSVAERLLYSNSGGLASFATRADVAYVCGLISKVMYQDLKQMAELRNLVAHHHFALDFNSADVANHCAALQYARSLRVGDTDERVIREEFLNTPRNQFGLSAVLIANRLIMNAMSAQHVQPRV